MTLDLFFRVACGVILLAAFATSGYYRAQADRLGGPLPPRPAGLSVPSRVAAGMVKLALLLTPMVAPGAVPWMLLALPDAGRWAGLLLGLALVPFIRWTMRSLGTNVSPSTDQRRGATLVTHGPYRRIRHPIYTAGVTAFIAAGLMLRSWVPLALAALFVAWLPFRVRSEESRLLATFGDAYREYMGTTGRFLPRFRPRAT
jgi:protein-S-isoprenylcysteine O-methyltransferase Ste14